MSTPEEDDVLLEQHLASSCPPKFRQYLNDLVTRLKRVDFDGGYLLAKEVIQLLLQFIGTVRSNSPLYLMKLIKAVGRRLIRARSVELVIGNAVRRVLFLIREEGAQLLKEEQKKREDAGLDGILSQTGSHDSLEIVSNKELRPILIDGLNEMLEELENMFEPISKQALEHIHANELVLVYGKSRSVQIFLEAAKRKRNFEVIVAEAAPGCEGHDMAKALSVSNIKTTVITDSAIMAMMSRVNKVLIGTKAVLANGGVLARSGAHLVALAAKHHRVPMVCVSGLYKLSPLYAHDINSFKDLKSPGSVLDYGDIESENVQVLAPSYDYVPPDLVSLFITNNGGHQPSYVYRLLHEYYHPDDTNL